MGSMVSISQAAANITTSLPPLYASREQKFSTLAPVKIWFACVSAWNIGSDSNLMILRIQVACFLTENQRHASSVSSSSLIPPDFAAEQVCETAEAIVVTAHPLADGALCPRCGTSSFRVHSRYYRKISDLPCSARRLVLHVSARRFFCVAKECHQKIFVERFGNDVIRPMARRTTRLDYLVHHLALALGGRPAARFADRRTCS